MNLSIPKKKKKFSNIDGQDNLLKKTKRKFENKVLENVTQKIAIDQVEIYTLISSLENVVNNFVSLFVKLSDTINITKEIKDKLAKIDMDLKDSVNQLALNPSSSSNHFVKVMFLTHLQAKLLREEGRIRETLVDI